MFRCAEINSSFHRPHAPTTYAKWAASTPAGFRFSVKLPKTITHERRLVGTRADLERFLDETAALETRRGPLLIQLPPSFAFDNLRVGRFLSLLRSLHSGPVVCEPRHPSWVGKADAVLQAHRVARVAADPALVPGFENPGGWTGLTYFRWHGSPRTYWSSYPAAVLDAVVPRLRAATGEAWFVFDNTASGAALENAWHLQQIAAVR